MPPVPPGPGHVTACPAAANAEADEKGMKDVQEKRKADAKTGSLCPC
jgi:hypothetical protein